MKPFPSGDAEHPPTVSEYAEVASLATKVVALPDRDPYGPADPRQRHTALLIHQRSRMRRWTSWLFYAAVWLVTLAMGLLAALGTFYHDGSQDLIWINAFTRYIFLAAYACLALALWQRRWCLTLVCVAIIGYHVAWLAPDFVRDQRFDVASNVAAAAAPSTKTVRIFFANVRRTNHEYAALLREINEVNPDVVILVECVAEWVHALANAPEMAAFTYGNLKEQPFHEWIIVASKLPLAAIDDLWIAERRIETVTIPLGSQTLTLVSLHSPRPVGSANNDYQGFWDQVIPLLLAKPRPLVVVGDCNATQYSSVYQQIKSSGLRSAHEDRGRGYATTWPNDFRLRGWLPVPPIRIDQAFLSTEVECVDIAEGKGLGSDHKPLILDVRIRDHL